MTKSTVVSVLMWLYLIVFAIAIYSAFAFDFNWWQITLVVLLLPGLIVYESLITDVYTNSMKKELGLFSNIRNQIYKDVRRSYKDLNEIPSFDDIGNQCTYTDVIQKRLFVIASIVYIQYKYKPFKCDQTSQSFLKEYKNILLFVKMDMNIDEH